MSEINAAVEVFHRVVDLLRTIRELCDAGYDPQKLSVVTRDSKASMNSFSTSRLDGESASEIESVIIRDGIQILQPGWTCFRMPRLGVILSAGPLAGWINAALVNKALFSGLSAVGAGLCSIGIPRSLVPFYEAELKAGRFLLIAHGSTGDVQWARGIIDALQKKAIAIQALRQIALIIRPD